MREPADRNKRLQCGMTRFSSSVGWYFNITRNKQAINKDERTYAATQAVKIWRMIKSSSVLESNFSARKCLDFVAWSKSTLCKFHQTSSWPSDLYIWPIPHNTPTTSQNWYFLNQGCKNLHDRLLISIISSNDSKFSASLTTLSDFASVWMLTDSMFESAVAEM